MKFLSKPQVSATRVTDASGNGLWSVGVCVANEDEIIARDRVPLRAYASTKRSR